MSVESARAFVDRLVKDQTFRDKLMSASGEDAQIKAAREAGYDFTREDMVKLLPKGVTLDQLRNLDPKSDELPDEVLEAVAGGKSQAESDMAEIGISVGAEAAAAAVVAAAAI